MAPYQKCRRPSVSAATLIDRRTPEPTLTTRRALLTLVSVNMAYCYWRYGLGSTAIPTYFLVLAIWELIDEARHFRRDFKGWFGRRKTDPPPP